MARYTTLYIEDNEIKLLVTNGKNVEKWASLLLEPGLVSDGVIIDQETVAMRIRELLKLQQVSAGKVIAALSGLNSIFRVVSLPELPQDLIHEAVYNEANRVIPLPLDQVYLSYQLIPSLPGETRIFLVAVPRNSTDALFKTLARAGLGISLLDLAPLALCRSAEAPKAIVVNSWLSNADIAIMADRVPQVIRSVALITESTNIEEKLANIAEELHRTVAFYNSSHSEDPLDASVPVFVSGDLAHQEKLWPELVHDLGFKVSVLPSPLNAPEAFDASQYMVNIGLVSKVTQPESADAVFSVININAVPREYLPKGISWANILAPVLAAGIIAGLVYGWTFVQNTKAETDDLRTQLAGVEAQVASARATIPPLQTQVSQIEKAIPPKIATATGLAGTFTGLRTNRFLVVEDIRIALQLEGDIAELSLTDITHDGSTFVVKGEATNESHIFEYARALDNTGRFEIVVVSSITSELLEDEDEEEQTEVFNFELILL